MCGCACGRGHIGLAGALMIPLGHVLAVNDLGMLDQNAGVVASARVLRFVGHQIEARNIRAALDADQFDKPFIEPFKF